MEFTYNAYVQLLGRLKDNGYTLSTFRDSGASTKPIAILRHDIDLSPRSAVKIALHEHAMGVQATYFVMLTSSWYNVLDRENEAAIDDIQRLGHEIGLHFDISKYGDIEDRELEDAVMSELKLLSEVTGRRVRSLSWHIPPKGLLGKKLDFLDGAGVLNAYDPEFFYGYKYLSDSMMRWREEPEDCIDNVDFPKLQILTHPVWYSERGGRTSEKALRAALADKIAAQTDYLETIKPSMKKRLRGRLLWIRE